MLTASEVMTSAPSGKSTPVTALMVSSGASWQRVEKRLQTPNSPGSFGFVFTAMIGAATTPATMSPMTKNRPASRSNCRPRRGGAYSSICPSSVTATTDASAWRPKGVRPADD